MTVNNVTVSDAVIEEKVLHESRSELLCTPSDKSSGHLIPDLHHVYIKVTADLRARQMNGDIVLEEADAPRSKHVYYGVVATDESLQINGNISDPETLRDFFSSRARP